MKKVLSLGKRYKNIFADEKRNNLVFFIVPLFLSIYVACMPELFLARPAGYFWAHAKYFLLSTLFFYILHMLFAFLFRKLSVSVLLVGGLGIAAGIGNYFKLLYRKSPVMPRDIFMIRDALVVTTETIKITLTGIMILSIVLVVVFSALLWPVRTPNFVRTGKKPSARILKGVTAVVLCLCCVAGMLWGVFFNKNAMGRLGVTLMTAPADSYYINTFFPTFFYLFPDSFPTAPPNYPNNLSDITKELEQLASQPSDAKPVDIVYFVVESWFGLDNYDVDISIDPFANYNELAKEGTAGLSVPPYYGGGTANVEYELLTGFTSGGFLTEEICFNYNIYPGFPSISNYLSDAGYSTYAMHAYSAHLYNRFMAYEMLGFDYRYFIDDFVDADYMGSFISDISCADMVIDAYSQSVAQSDDPVFIHMMTMQNHFPFSLNEFSYSDLPVVTSSSIQNPDFLLYLACYAYQAAITDQAIANLVDYFRTVDRDVLLVVLGDHQTPITTENGSDILAYTDFYDSYNETDDYLDLHSTPYLVWANFDNERGDSFGNIPPNMLGVNALIEYGVVRPIYYDYLYRHTTSMNGMTGNYVVDLNGNVSFSMTAAQADEAALRELLQYDLIYGNHVLSPLIYGP